MSTAEKLRAEGRQEGRQEGALTKARSLLVRQIELRFGAPSPQTLERIHQAPLDELDVWAERILTATSIDDLLV